MKKWNAWNSGMGDKVIEPGLYFGMSKTVSAQGVADDGGSNPLSGITIIEAEKIEDALELAKACPHCDIGGTIEVAPNYGNVIAIFLDLIPFPPYITLASRSGDRCCES